MSGVRALLIGGPEHLTEKVLPSPPPNYLRAAEFPREAAMKAGPPDPCSINDLIIHEYERSVAPIFDRNGRRLYEVYVHVAHR